MATEADFEILDAFLSALHERLFPKDYELVDWEELKTCVLELTGLLNKALKFYHTVDKNDGRMKYSPTMNYGQSILKTMTRLLKFDQKDLTKYNQVLSDLEQNLLNKQDEISTKYTEISKYQIKMVNNEEFKEIADRFLRTFIIFEENEEKNKNG